MRAVMGLADCTLDVGMTDDDSYAPRYAAEQKPRWWAAPGCDIGVGDVVFTRGYGGAGTYRTEGELISGAKAWQLSLDDGLTSSINGAAQTTDGYVAVDVRNGLHVLDLEGRARTTIDAPVVAHLPTVTTERAFVIVSHSPADFSLLSIALDGTACWQLASYGSERFATVMLADGVLIASAKFPGSHSTVLALDPATGALLWSHAVYGSVADPVAADGIVLLGFDPATRGAVALDLRTGATLWVTEPRHSVHAVAVADGVAYVEERGLGLTARAVTTGETLWIAERLEVDHLAIGNGRIVAIGARRAYGLDPEDGSVVWTLGEAERTTFGQPAIADGVVYILTDHGLFAHALDDGAELLRVEDDDLDLRGPSRGPLPFGDVVLVYDYGGGLHAYR
jgi:outer membrane protein assembly factor BamB